MALGGWYISSRDHSAGGPGVLQNPPVVSPQSQPRAPNEGGGQQPQAGGGSSATSPNAAGTATEAANHRQQIEEAKGRGDAYYENGEYTKATKAYQAGLKLDPSNSELRKAVESAQRAQAAEQKFNH